MSSDSITFRCGGCQNVIGVSAAMQGRMVRCPHCQSVVAAPTDTAPTAPTPPTAPVEPMVEEMERMLTATEGVPTNGMAEHFVPQPPSNTHQVEPFREPSAPPEESPWESAAPDRLGLPGQANRTGKAARPAEKKVLGVSLWIMAILLPLTIASLVANVVLLYHHYQLNTQLQSLKESPLKTLPDSGVYSDFEGKRVIVRRVQNLKQDDIVPLGETRSLGGIEVTPLAVYEDDLHYKVRTFSKAFKLPDPITGKVLYLKLRIRNASEFQLHPLDPTFNLAHHGDQKYSQYTFLRIPIKDGDVPFYGGVRDPALEEIEGPNYQSIYPDPRFQLAMKGREGAPIVPTSDTMETVVLAVQDEKFTYNAVEEVAKLKDDQELTWHVQLRTGKELQMVDGVHRYVWRTSVLGVKFKKSDITKGDKK